MVTVYRPFPLEQFVTLLKMPMLSPPAIAVDVLTVGGEMMAQPVEPPPPPPPLPPLPRCANRGRAANTRQTNTNVGLIKPFFMLPPRLIETELRALREFCFYFFGVGAALDGSVGVECRSNIDSARVLLTAGNLTGLFPKSQWCKTAIFSARPKPPGLPDQQQRTCQRSRSGFFMRVSSLAQ